VQPGGEPLARRGEYPRPLAELAPDLLPDRGDKLGAQLVPFGEVAGVELERWRGPDLAEGEARLSERRLQLVDGEVSFLRPHRLVDAVEAGGVPLIGEAGGLGDE
jgi:hypothetical protein